ncbi:DNA primase [Acetobacter sp. TBRC 12305]|uniref:DNA primase n=1 Tax=Acetobacter garciniae TaxID=2817435 RepID=A0A939HMC1_9PROT|nr:DNA primase [Acetobacter garciniae]MBO1323962.1 DNA primase [Acetobacter garciniae]MBX0343651.1 DNA primase [Acetobacter garciniae]
MAIDPGFLEELRARTPLTSVIGRRVKLARSGRNWKGCCPFHGEKTPSFYVYDDHFHCFGCGAHGDVISFVMQMEGKAFPEAVEELASAAGMEVPVQTQAARQVMDHARTLEDVLAAAQKIWSAALWRPEGRAGLDYLLGRGLTRQTITAFGLGWASEGRGDLVKALAPEGITPEKMAEAGLMRVDEDGKPKGELFWGRVTFPIRDRRGRLVSFGGRILGDGQPKYLNGPETPLFSKRRLLFGLDRARAAVRAPRPRGVEAPALVVVEGYMDVIALHQAGFAGAVAPLGTALTAEQLEVLWQVSPLPILCFDGDGAGRRAAIKAAETALPLLKAGHSLRLCLLPEGEDPDSMVRGRGEQAVAELFANAQPLTDVLFDLLTSGMSAPGPEERAALRTRLTETAALIPDRALAAEYRSTLLDRFFSKFRGGKGGKGQFGGRSGGAGAGGWSSGMSAGQGFAGTAPVMVDQARERQRLMLRLLLHVPTLMQEVEEALCRLDLPADLAPLREMLLDLSAEGRLPQTGGALRARLETMGGEDALRLVQLVEGTLPRPDEFTESDDPAQTVAARTQWWHFYGLLHREQFIREVARDIAGFAENGGDSSQWQRLQARMDIMDQLRRGGVDDADI